MTMLSVAIPLASSLLGVLVAAVVARVLLRDILSRELYLHQARIDARQEDALQFVGEAFLRDVQGHAIKFSKVLERREETVSTLYAMLNSTAETEAIYSAMGEAGKAYEERRKEFTFFILDYKEAARHFQANRLFLSEEACRCLEELFSGVRARSSTHSTAGRIVPILDRDAAKDCFKRNLPTARLALEKEFRSIHDSRPVHRDAA